MMNPWMYSNSYRIGLAIIVISNSLFPLLLSRIIHDHTISMLVLFYAIQIILIGLFLMISAQIYDIYNRIKCIEESQKTSNQK